jgi:hypothetical protein
VPEACAVPLLLSLGLLPRLHFPAKLNYKKKKFPSLFSALFLAYRSSSSNLITDQLLDINN